MKKGVKIIIIVAIILIISLMGIAMYLMYSSARPCTTQTCFDNSLKNCRMAFFIRESDEVIMQYRIVGQFENSCKVDVKLLQIKKGTTEISDLEGKSMTCDLRLGTISLPEADLSLCHGILREEIQDLIIKRMHSQLMENIGQVSQETTKVL